MHPRSQLAVQRLAADAQLACRLRDIAACALQGLVDGGAGELLQAEQRGGVAMRRALQTLVRGWGHSVGQPCGLGPGGRLQRLHDVVAC